MSRVGIIGLGQIAAAYGSPEDAAPYTHAGGINRSDRVELAAVADFSESARLKFQKKWGEYFPDVHYYSKTATLLEEEDLDIVALCVRGPHHYPVLLEVLEARPRAVFLEKPPTCSLQEMDAVVSRARDLNIPITVSYSRHWGPHVLRMADLVRDGLFGEVQSVVGFCGKAFLSFASHTTDMICQFAGYDPVAVYARGTIPEVDVPEGYEPEPFLSSITIEYASGKIGTQVGSPDPYGNYFSCIVEGSEGRAYIPFYGDPAAWDKDGQPLGPETLAIPENRSPFQVAYEQIANYLEGGSLPDCTNDDFVKVHEIGFAGIESLFTNQRVELPNTNRQRLVFANG